MSKRLRYAPLLALLLATSSLAAIPQPIPKSDSPPAPKLNDGPVSPPTLTGPTTANYLAAFNVRIGD